MQRLFTRCLPFLDAPDHTRLRKVLQPAFRPDRMQALKPLMQSLIDELLDEAGEEFDFMTAVARPLPARVIAKLMDVDASVYADFTLWSEDLAAFLGAANPTQAQVRAAQHSVVALAGYFERELLSTLTMTSATALKTCGSRRSRIAWPPAWRCHLPG
jgi:cytochrome P450